MTCFLRKKEKGGGRKKGRKVGKERMGEERGKEGEGRKEVGSGKGREKKRRHQSCRSVLFSVVAFAHICVWSTCIADPN